MRPSEVPLTRSFPPLADTLGRSEVEAAATLIVRACQVFGDVWQPISWAKVKDVWARDAVAGNQPLAALLRNPFWVPNVHALAASPFARWVGPGTDAVEFTSAGLMAIEYPGLWRRKDA